MYKNIIVPPATTEQNTSSMSDYMVTSIYPVRDGLAMMVTNSLGGLRVDVWLVFERHMVLIDDVVYTRLSYVDFGSNLDIALRIARKYAFAIYLHDISPDENPF